MTATLKFNLPEEADLFRHATNATALVGALEDLDNDLRNFLKHGSAPIPGMNMEDVTVEVLATSIRRRLNEALAPARGD